MTVKNVRWFKAGVTLMAPSPETEISCSGSPSKLAGIDANAKTVPS